MSNLPFAAAEPVSNLGWMLGTLGLGDLLTLAAALALFAWSCYVVGTHRPPRVLAASMTLLPIPVVIAVCNILDGAYSSLSVIAVSDQRPTAADYAAGNAELLFRLLLAILVTAPSHLVLAFGLIARVWRDSAPARAPEAETARTPLSPVTPGLAH